MTENLPEKIKKPDWLRVRLPIGENYRHVRGLVDTHKLHTICESGNCPNMGECWGAGTATFMILGNICTLNCTFCAVQHGKPRAPDPQEPDHIVQAVARMGLRYVVITSVTRDDLPDGGASRFAQTIRAIHEYDSNTAVEILVPDFQGLASALQVVVDAGSGERGCVQ